MHNHEWFRRFGTYILPIYVITNFPGLFLMGNYRLLAFFWGDRHTGDLFPADPQAVEDLSETIQQCKLLIAKMIQMINKKN